MKTEKMKNKHKQEIKLTAEKIDTFWNMYTEKMRNIVPKIDA
jgi:hypothetical protein